MTLQVKHSMLDRIFAFEVFPYACVPRFRLTRKYIPLSKSIMVVADTNLNFFQKGALRRLMHLLSEERGFASEIM